MGKNIVKGDRQKYKKPVYDDTTSAILLYSLSQKDEV